MKTSVSVTLLHSAMKVKGLREQVHYN